MLENKTVDSPEEQMWVDVERTFELFPVSGESCHHLSQTEEVEYLLL